MISKLWLDSTLNDGTGRNDAYPFRRVPSEGTGVTSAKKKRNQKNHSLAQIHANPLSTRRDDAEGRGEGGGMRATRTDPQFDRFSFQLGRELGEQTGHRVRESWFRFHR